MPLDSDDRLLRPYQPVRHVAAGSDAPWPGLLARTDAGEALVLVDSSALGDEWAGWRVASDGHVLAPVEIVRRSGGHDVALPACAGTVDEFLIRRRDGRVPLTAGETVTLAVSALRALAELGEGLDEVTGRWWLTDDGRPVLATDLGTDPVLDGTRTLIEQIGGALGDRDLVEDLLGAFSGGHMTVRDFERLEHRLFATATAEPLSDAPLVSQRPPGPQPITIAQARRSDAEPLMSDPPTGVIDRLVRHVDADVADLVSRATTGLWRRLRAGSPASRGRVWAIAGGAATVVVLMGFLWPTDSDPVAAETPAAESSAGATPAVQTHDDPTPTVTDPGGSTPRPSTATDEDDLTIVTTTLLTERSACDGDAGCLAVVVVDPTSQFPAGATDLDADERTTVVLDEFGGVAVLRVEARDGQAQTQLVVIQREQDEWLLRDVYVAQQP